VDAAFSRRLLALARLRACPRDAPLAFSIERRMVLATKTLESAAGPASVAAQSAASPRKSVRRFMPLFVVAAALATYVGFRAYQATRPFEWSGTVEARTIAVGSRTGGRVKDVLVREGDQVAAGQPLLVLEPGDLDATRLMMQAQLEQAQANLEKLEKGSRPEEIEEARAKATTAVAALREAKHGARSEQIQGARARLIALQVAVDKAQLDDDRARKLVQSGAVSQSEQDNADSALRGALAQRDNAKESLNELENGEREEDVAQAAARAQEAQASARLVIAGTRVEDLKAARATVDSFAAQVEQIKIKVDELVVKSPRPARVESLDLRPGDIVAPNATAATLLEDDQLYVRIYVPETLIGRIRVGQEVPITVDSFANRSFQGIVEHINSVGEYSPRNLQTADERADQVFAARIGLRDGKDELRAGMAAFITVPR
jgi:HlyD family secretion protein